MVSQQEFQAYHQKKIDEKQKKLIEISHLLSNKDLKKLSSDIINHKKSIGFSKSGKMQVFYLPKGAKP